MQSLKLGEIQLEYVDAGSGTTVIFIHGVATHGELWAEELSELTASCRLIAYNRRGYGKSSASPYNWDAHTADAIALIQALAAEPVVLVGYSAGAIIALGATLKRPELVKRVVILDPAYNIKRCMTPSLIKVLVTIRLLRLLGNDRAATIQWLRYVSSYSTGGSAFDTKASAKRKEQLLQNASGIFADMASDGGSADEHRLNSISVPVTLVDAKLSPSFLRRSSQRLGKLMPQANRITLEQSGHWIGVDARDKLMGILRDAAK